MSLLVVDYGSGNIASVLNMIRRQGGTAIASRNPDAIRGAGKLILPGVGAFNHGMSQLHELGLVEPIRESVTAGAIILGICLGMQLLGNRSEEGDTAGLRLIDADFKHFSFEDSESLPVPHVGWNRIRVAKPNPIIAGDGEQRFYFTHSYYAVCARDEDVLATTEYGYPFVAAFSRDNVFGVQFHPEKSHRFGMAVMRNFLSL